MKTATKTIDSETPGKMKEEPATRKRFHKPCHFLNRGGGRPVVQLYEIFNCFHLDDFRTELRWWQELALSNDQSAYDEGGAREDLLEFVYELERVIEALHLVSRERNRQKINEQMKRLPKETKKLLSKINRPLLLTAAEQSAPATVIGPFCKKFTRSYAAIELLDLLEAVITYEGHKEIYKGNLVLFYQHLHGLVRLAYKMQKPKTGSQAERTPGA